MDDVGAFLGWSMGHQLGTQVCSINKTNICSVDRQLERNKDTLESGDGYKQRKLETNDEYDAPNLGVWLTLQPL